MSASAGRGFDASYDAGRGFRRVFVTLLRAFGSTVALVAIYYLLPLDRSSLGVAIGILAVGLLALIGLVAYQVRTIMRAAYPVERSSPGPCSSSQACSGCCRGLLPSSKGRLTSRARTTGSQQAPLPGDGYTWVIHSLFVHRRLRD